MYSDTILDELLSQYSFLKSYLDDLDIVFDTGLSFDANMELQDETYFEQRKTEKEILVREFDDYLVRASAILEEEPEPVDSITILPGRAKDGSAETFDAIETHPGEILAIVGETGSGKTRLLEDIEWLAGGDTPTGRTILLNGERRDPSRMMAKGHRMIAQLSQNMNFVLDMSVGEFLTMHAECFGSREKAADQVRLVYDTAQTVCGEKFDLNASVTSLSGGQSRALMIADCAVISKAPIVLIDEVENAGIDRRLALDILTGSRKIVFIATHDPVLSMLADRRIVISGGGIRKVITRSDAERPALEEAERLDSILMGLRRRIRAGECII